MGGDGINCSASGYEADPNIAGIGVCRRDVKLRADFSADRTIRTNYLGCGGILGTAWLVVLILVVFTCYFTCCCYLGRILGNA